MGLVRDNEEYELRQYASNIQQNQHDHKEVGKKAGDFLLHLAKNASKLEDKGYRNKIDTVMSNIGMQFNYNNFSKLLFDPHQGKIFSGTNIMVPTHLFSQIVDILQPSLVITGQHHGTDSYSYRGDMRKRGNYQVEKQGGRENEGAFVKKASKQPHLEETPIAYPVPKAQKK